MHLWKLICIILFNRPFAFEMSSCVCVMSRYVSKEYAFVPPGYLEDSFIKSGVFSVSELVRVSRSKCLFFKHKHTDTSC